MPAKDHKLLAWSPERAEALAAWLRRGAELGVSFAAPNGQHSDAAAVGEALKRAVACRCEERLMALPEAIEIVKDQIVSESANPLRLLRTHAGLSQAEAAARCGMTRGAWANAEKAAKATSAMVERAQAALRTK